MGRTGFAIALAPLSLALAPAVQAAGAGQDCAAALMPAGELEQRPVAAEDLAGLRDIGANYNMPLWAGLVPAAPRAMALSPDGTRLAFELRRGNPADNSFCLGIFVLELREGARPVPVDLGGELTRRFDEFRGKSGYPTGLVPNRLPRWTSDGKAILFLSQRDGPVQVWRAEADGSGSRQVTHSPDDVLDFRLAGDERTIIYKTQPGVRAGLAAIEAEALEGFHYDERFSPMAANRPFVPGPLPFLTWVQSDRPGASPGPAESSQEALFGLGPAAPEGVVASASSGRGELAWLAIDGEHFPPRMRLGTRLVDGRSVICTFEACEDGIGEIWWTQGGQVRFIRREGWNKEATAIYQWKPGAGAPQRLYSTNDVLTGCLAEPAAIICLREGSLRPRHIARIELPSGRESEIYDPNPEFRSLQLGEAERLHWRNEQGLEVFGDLVLPVGYEKGRRYPLIIVQYDSRGFLRGGTGDEYPIQLFAAHGFAVLSFDRPTDFGTTVGAQTLAEAQRANDKDYADRKSVHSALENGINLLVERGIVDPGRIGITGLSDGASTANYALINSDLFAAAAFSSCCWDASLAISVGPGAMKTFADRYPSVMSDADPIWAPVSIARNAARLDVPMLIQVSDGELLSALTAFTALRDHRQPAAMYVFPGEYHIKYQPAHRLALYRRNLAWFQFWLGSDLPIDIAPGELERWMALREERAARSDGASARASDPSRLPLPAAQAASPDLPPNSGDRRRAAVPGPAGR